MIVNNVILLCGEDCHRFSAQFQPDEKILFEAEREVVRYKDTKALKRAIGESGLHVFCTEISAMRV